MSPDGRLRHWARQPAIQPPQSRTDFRVLGIDRLSVEGPRGNVITAVEGPTRQSVEGCVHAHLLAFGRLDDLRCGHEMRLRACTSFRLRRSSASASFLERLPAAQLSPGPGLGPGSSAGCLFRAPGPGQTPRDPAALQAYIATSGWRRGQQTSSLGFDGAAPGGPVPGGGRSLRCPATP